MKSLLLLGVLTYLAASINFSIILFKILGQGDPRDRFSGNAGTSNVSRQLGKFWGALILLLDVGRAVAVAQIGVWYLPGPWVPLLGLILVIGNQRPLFHGFRGGKGVAGYLGFTAFLSPFTAGISCLSWVMAFALFRVTFISSFFMIAVLGGGIIVKFPWDPLAAITAVLTIALIIGAHKTNIRTFQKKRMARENSEG